jgi:hypothetical protein
MKNQRDRLHQYQKKIKVLTDKETDIAKQMLAKNDKKRALLALRRKKFQESLLAKTDAQLAQLEKLTSDVEFALIQKDVVFGLQQGTKVLKEIHAEMGGIENVEKLMGETADAIAYQQVCCYSHIVLRTVSFLHAFRKLAICLEGACRTRTSKKWKTSWKLSKPNSRARRLQNGYPTSPTANFQSDRGSRHRPKGQSSQLCSQHERWTQTIYLLFQSIFWTDRQHLHFPRAFSILRLG